MSWQEECIYVKWQGPPPFAGQEFFPQNQPLRLSDSREDAREYDPNEGRPGKDCEKGDRGYEVLEIF